MKYGLLFTTAVCLSGCAHLPRDSSTSSYLFPVPTNNYQVGDVVSIFTYPLYQVSPVVRPEPTSIQTTSNNLDISKTTEKNFTAVIKAQIEGAITLIADPALSQKTTVKLTSVRTVTAFQDEITNALVSRLKSTPSSCSAMKYNIEKGTRMDVIESIIYANVDVTVTSSTGAKVNLDSSHVQKINASANLGLKATSDGTLIGESLGYSYTTNPNLAGRVYSETCN